MHTIGFLSAHTGVEIETIRYYERVGVLPKPRRTLNGRRTYGEQDLGRLVFIRRARALGFELSTIRALMALQDRPDAPCEGVSDLARAHRADVEHRIGQLVALRDERTRMIDACQGGRWRGVQSSEP